MKSIQSNAGIAFILRNRQRVKLLGKHSEVLQVMTFSDVVEVLKSLSTDEKGEIQLLLTQYLREERRDKIYENFSAAQVEQQKGELKFSSNVNELKQLIE
jgi:hypothetical protein